VELHQGRFELGVAVVTPIWNFLSATFEQMVRGVIVIANWSVERAGPDMERRRYHHHGHVGPHRRGVARRRGPDRVDGSPTCGSS
jgi:hypothetical protein